MGISGLVGGPAGPLVASAASLRSARGMASTRQALAWLRQHGSKKVRDGMARFGIPCDGAFGVPVGELRKYAKQLGRDHGLAEQLWQDGRYEARMLATMVDDPALVTPSQMDRWCQDFDSWALCDTACFSLFDRTPHAFRKVDIWSGRKGEFQKRAAFALLASVAQHDKQAADEPFLQRLPRIEAAADDDRNFVKKGVSWALRGVGERNQALHEACLEVAARLLERAEPSARWIGRDAQRELNKPAVKKRVARRSR